MISTIFQQIFFGTPEYDESYQLRYNILRVPLGLEFYIEDIEKEYKDYHLAIYNQSTYIMLGILILTEKANHTFKMRQVAIREDHQKSGIGRILVTEAEDFCKKLGGKEIVLNARNAISPFYEKLGYNKAGNVFTEVGIEHIQFRKKI